MVGARRALTLARYDATGTLDPSFGSNGVVRTLIASGDAGARAVLVQSYGKVAAAGLACAEFFVRCTFALARYNGAGVLDRSFGCDGVVTTDIGPDESEASAAALQPDGRIVVVGSAAEFITGFPFERFALARYDADGQLDATFGAGGVVTNGFGLASFGGDVARAVALGSGGGVIVGGSASVESGGSTVPFFALARYDAGGVLDPAFGNGGRVVTLAGLTSTVNVLSLDAAGRIVAGGTADSGTFDFALARYERDGSLDESFGSGGVVTTDVGGGFDDIRGVVLQPDGKIVVGGFVFPGGAGTGEFAIARYGG